MKKRPYFSLLLGFMTILFGHKAYAQVTLSEFKVDGATSIKVYTTVNTPRLATFTVKLTRPFSSIDNPSVRVNLIGGLGGSEQEIIGGITITSQTSWTGNGSNQSSTVTGRMPADKFAVFSGYYTGVQAVALPGGSSTLLARSNAIPIIIIANPTNPPAITLTNFTVDNATSININENHRTVTYRVTLSKDPGYTDEFTIRVGGANGGLVIPDTYFLTQNNGWTVSGNQRVYSVVKSFDISTGIVGPSATQLIAQAISGAFLIGASTNMVILNRVATPIPCISDVYLQNITSLVGTKSAGKTLYAGRAVTATTNGDVVIRTGTTAVFLAREQVVLADGFNVEPGADFSVSIHSNVCSTSRDGIAPEETADAVKELSSPVPSPQLAQDTTPALKRMAGSLKVFPNPVSSEMNVVLPEDGSAHELRIYDSFGREAKRMILEPGKTKVDVHSLQPGIYYLHVQQQGNVVKTRFCVSQ